MHVISRKPFNDAATKHPNCRDALQNLYRTLRGARFSSSPDEMRAVFPSLNNFTYRDKWWVIDIGDNTLRMIAFIEFRDNRLYVRYIVNHADYDKLCARYRKGEL